MPTEKDRARVRAARLSFVFDLLACLGAAALLLYSAASLAGVEDDYREALALYQRGDVVTAIARLRPGASADHAPSQALLADILEGAAYGNEALTWYVKAADAGHPDAMFALGSLYAIGRGVARDEARARELVTRAAQAGHKGAIDYAAQAAIAGTLGFPQLSAQDKRGLPWVMQSAANGNLAAIDFLARAYRTGALGETDLRQAEALEAQADRIRYDGRKKPAKKKSS